MALSSVLYGCMPLLIKIAYENGGNPISTAFYRFFLALPLVFLLMRRQVGRRWLLRGPTLRKTILLSVAFGLTPFMMLIAYSYITTGMATSIMYIYPVFVLLGSILIYKEKALPIRIFCAGLCILGVFLCYASDFQGNAIGVSLAVASGVAYAFYVVYLGKSGLAEVPSFQLVFHVLLFSSIGLFFVALFSGELTIGMNATGWVATICFSLIASACAGLLFQIGITRIGPQRAAILSALDPVTCVLISVFVLNEAFTVTIFFGIACILISSTVLAFLDKN
ncbi:DMT family transporter [Ruminococcaceae bacterium OttesenSCG-928-I18]|nr:DMT family transporter [Ruminococcaceae bacterium OttesenSCG-928-I18]